MTHLNDYIFISYAHKDADDVLPIVQALKENGFNVWYDEGIEAGTEWPEYIAQRIKNCSVFIAFLSPNAINSNNCRNEINYAISLQKQFLAVYLRETVMTAGMELQLGSIQAMFKYRHDSDESFIRALVGANILQQLRAGMPVTKTVVTPTPAPVAPKPKTEVKQKKTKRTTACRRSLVITSLFALVLGCFATYFLTPFYQEAGFVFGLLITAGIVATTALPLSIAISSLKKKMLKYPVAEQKQVYEDIFSCFVAF